VVDRLILKMTPRTTLWLILQLQRLLGSHQQIQQETCNRQTNQFQTVESVFDRISLLTALSAISMPESNSSLFLNKA